MGFILGVLVIGALLAANFGRQAGMLFVTGTLSLTLVCIGIFLVLISPLIWGFLTAPSPPPSSTGYSSYQPAQPAQTYQSQSTAQTSNYSNQNSGSASFVPAPGPSIGIVGTNPSPQDQAAINRACNPPLPKDFGMLVTSVNPGSPAEAAGIERGDILAVMGLANLQGQAITPSNSLPSFESFQAAGTRIWLLDYRLSQNRKFHVWVTPR